MIWLRPLLLAVAVFCLALGLVLPIMRFERLYFFSETPSLIELVSTLWSGGNAGLALVVGLVSIVFPIVKLGWLGLEILGGEGRSGVLHRFMPYLSKWSMMDVMLVAIVIFAAKTSGLAEAVAQPGLWFYAASAIIAGVLPALPKPTGS